MKLKIEDAALPLVWQDDGDGGYSTRGAIVEYKVARSCFGCHYYVTSNGHPLKVTRARDEAKHAAEQDYQQRLRAAFKVGTFE